MGRVSRWDVFPVREALHFISSKSAPIGGHCSGSQRAAWNVAGILILEQLDFADRR